MPRKLLALALLLLASCSVQIGHPPATDSVTAVYRQPQSGPLGTTWIKGCDFTRPTIDPRFDESQRAAIRSAARQWEEAVGVDLGPLPAAEESCVPAVTPACIALGDASAPAPYTDARAYEGIVLYPSRISDFDQSFELVAMHELGHYIGVAGHGTAGIMRPHVPLPDRVCQVDIDLFEAYCVDVHD